MAVLEHTLSDEFKNDALIHVRAAVIGRVDSGEVEF